MILYFISYYIPSYAKIFAYSAKKKKYLIFRQQKPIKYCRINVYPAVIIIYDESKMEMKPREL